MQYILEDGGGRGKEPAHHPRFKLRPDAVHPVHCTQQGGFVAVRIGARDPEADSCTVAFGKETLDVRVRTHHLVTGSHHGFILFA